MMTGKHHPCKLQRVKTTLGTTKNAATECRQHNGTTFHPIDMLLAGASHSYVCAVPKMADPLQHDRYVHRYVPTSVVRIPFSPPP